MSSMSSNWQRVPEDPDPKQDLGYDIEDLTVVESPTESHVVFLPSAESHLDDEAFIIADADAVCTPDR